MTALPEAEILVVDDDASIRFFLEELLNRDGHEVVSVACGEDALTEIDDREFDLALVDLKLEDISGTDVLEAISDQHPDTVVIMLTGHGSLESAVAALRQGAHDYLFKPCKTVELRESIRSGLLSRQQKKRQRALLRQLERHLSHSLEDVRATIQEDATAPASKPRSAPASAFPEEPAGDETRFVQRGGLIVDMARHVITLDGELLELSPTEFDVLAYLAAEAPRVVSPQELVREVQGYATEVWEARDTVRYHIYRIRQKIRDATERKDVIRTVRGVGYTLHKLEGH
jgi:DNA-binding response OmpR family regulator